FAVFDPIMYDTADAVAASLPAVPVPEIVKIPLVNTVQLYAPDVTPITVTIMSSSSSHPEFIDAPPPKADPVVRAPVPPRRICDVVESCVGSRYSCTCSVGVAAVPTPPRATNRSARGVRRSGGHNAVRAGIWYGGFVVEFAVITDLVTDVFSA